MQRILFLSMVYPRAYEPTRGTFCYATCKALAERHQVRVVSPRAWMECLRRPQPLDPRFVEEVGPTEYPCYIYPPGVMHATHGRWMWHSLRRQLLRTAAEFRPQGILSQWADPDGTTAVRLGREIGVPSGVIVGGSDVLLMVQDPRRRAVVARTLQSAQAVFAVSQDLREKTLALGVDPDRVHVVYRGVDEAFVPGSAEEARRKLDLPLDGEVVLWVGKMVPVKGLEVLLDAFAKLAAARPRALLVLVGDGPRRGAVEQRIAELGLQDRVRRVGLVESRHLPDWYRAADVTALSSHSEGIPNVLRESLASGTPYVATRVGGIAELGDHPALRLVPPNDAQAMATALEQALADKARIPADYVKRGWRASADQLADILSRSESAASSGPRPTSVPLPT